MSVGYLFELRDHPQHNDLSQFGRAAQERLNGFKLQTKQYSNRDIVNCI